MELSDALGILFASETTDFLELARQVGLDPRTDFRGADLRGLDLADADLAGADLRGADLSGAVLLRANLRGANLQAARLVDADLSWARLQHANLARADASRAKLRHAWLRGANCDELKLDSADLAHVSASVIRGRSVPRELAEHRGRRHLLFRREDLTKRRLQKFVLRVTAHRDQWKGRYAGTPEYKALTAALALADAALRKGNRNAIREAELRLAHTHKAARERFSSMRDQRVLT